MTPLTNTTDLMQAILAKLTALDQRNSRIETRLVVLTNALGHGDKLTPRSPDRRGTV